MNIKSFVFWTGVGVAAIVVSYFVIEWLKNNERLITATPHKEIGFHTIKHEPVPATA